MLALQEASVIGVADRDAQATRRPPLVNLHTAAGFGNALGNLVTAFPNHTPLIVTAGQQTREMLLMEPWLSNIEPENFRKPWVKWAYQPVRPQDVPATFMRAYAAAVQPPASSVFLSLPLDDWEAPALGPAELRTVATRIAPDPSRLAALAKAIDASTHPALVFGAAVAHGSGWAQAVALAEQLDTPVCGRSGVRASPVPPKRIRCTSVDCRSPKDRSPRGWRAMASSSWERRCSGITAHTCPMAPSCGKLPTTAGRRRAPRLATACSRMRSWRSVNSPSWWPNAKGNVHSRRRRNIGWHHIRRAPGQSAKRYLPVPFSTSQPIQYLLRISVQPTGFARRLAY